MAARRFDRAVNAPFYKVVRAVGTVIFRVASRPLILHRDRANRSGAWILAANHESPFDAALLIAATPRLIYWLSIIELFRNPLSRWFLSAMGAAPLDRSKADPRTMLRIARELRRGRVVGLFPEGGVRDAENSVLSGCAVDHGIARLAEISDAPVLPAVVLGGRHFRRWQSWLPLRRTRWAVAFGEPLTLRRDIGSAAARVELVRELQATLIRLRAEVREHGF